MIISSVSLQQLDQLNIRTFSVLNNSSDGTEETRKVTQFQYIGWPDQGLPPNTDGFRKLVDLVDVENANCSPIVIHCRFVIDEYFKDVTQFAVLVLVALVYFV